ncbi:MAG: acyl transferase [Saprospiraceae bacterium]|nr:acyl transferase [Saprospiraceae bacterium]
MSKKIQTDRIFSVKTTKAFNDLAIEIFFFQYEQNEIYQKFVNSLSVELSSIKHFRQIPFLPIEFFKSHNILIGKSNQDKIFLSSGTGNSQRSQHIVKDLSVYEESFTKGFKYFYGNPNEYCFLALLPNYLEQGDSSLIYMIDNFIENSSCIESGYYLNDDLKLIEKLHKLEEENQKIILIGVSYALLELAEKHKINIPNTIVMETGGMKGRRKEITREELHKILKQSFGVEQIHSEYGMTELLSQAYSNSDGRFYCPPWMKVLSREIYDPLSIQTNQKSGGLNIIDLANVNSCSFIATQDLGRVYQDESFEVLGRFDNSDVRGCNLMVI